MKLLTIRFQLIIIILTASVITDGQQPSRMDEEEWLKVTTFEEALRRIKDATGVSSVEVH